MEADLPKNEALSSGPGPAKSQPAQPSSEMTVSWAEVAPPLRSLHHKETINCFLVNASSKKPLVRRSNIALRRGVVIALSSSEAVKSGNHDYRRVAECKLEPQAVGLFVRQEEIIEHPTSVASRPVRALGKLNLRLIKRANKAGKPVMEISGVKLSEGATFRISSVHRVTPADMGDGVIDSDGSVDYYLVVECPQNPAGEGLFTQVPDVESVTEDVYAKEIEKLKLAPGEALPIWVVVTPKDGAEQASLFQTVEHPHEQITRTLKVGEVAINKNHALSIPASTELMVESNVTRFREKEYYRILKSPNEPAFEGLYLLTKETSPIQDVTSSSPEDAGGK